jgi:hypothetical protein
VWTKNADSDTRVITWSHLYSFWSDDVNKASRLKNRLKKTRHGEDHIYLELADIIYPAFLLQIDAGPVEMESVKAS